jgi:hypothetical protein
LETFITKTVELGLAAAEGPREVTELGVEGGTVQRETYEVEPGAEFEFPDFGTPVATPEGN